MKTVQAEIEYFDSKKNHWIHSDIEPKGCLSESLKDVENIESFFMIVWMSG
jgi:hypothetical protein